MTIQQILEKLEAANGCQVKINNGWGGLFVQKYDQKNPQSDDHSSNAPFARIASSGRFGNFLSKADFINALEKDYLPYF